ncbi:MAG: selenium cofactor biosynthesis protein YqeC [Candidatus Korobacteraceae bacterium]
MAKATFASITGRGLTLAGALGIAAGEVVALVGGGGKTTAMFRLAAELSSQGGRVLVTTTTHIFPPSSPELPPPILADTLAELLMEARDAFKRHPVLVVARGLNPDGRLAGIDPEWVGPLRDQLRLSNVLVEADGSRGRPLKAPATHEPVIPAATDLVVAVAGLSAIGERLAEERVHRAERVATLAGMRLGDLITAEAVARVLQHQEGSRKGVPGGARMAVLLNQADDGARLEAGRAVARSLIESGAWSSARIVIAALLPREGKEGPCEGQSAQPRAAPTPAIQKQACWGPRPGPTPVREIFFRTGEEGAASGPASPPVSVAAIVLAAGQGTGHGADQLRQELPADERVRAVYNPDFALGQSASLKAGINALAARTQAAVILLGDQPLISPEAIKALITAFGIQPAPLARTLYRLPSRQGQSADLPETGALAAHPVLFSRQLFPDLLQVTGDQGGRELLVRHQQELLAVNLDLEPPVDIDTMEDYLKAAQKFSDEG